MLSAPKTHPGIALAALALRRGYITARELRRALDEQLRDSRGGKGPRDLGVILLAQGALTPGVFQTLLADQQLLEPSPASDEIASLDTSTLEKWGRRIGRYLLVRELGHGRGALTYEAFDTVLERRVALKVFNKNRSMAAPHDEERFVREARLAASIPPHPHLVSVYDAGSVDGERYIAMELIHGRTFDSWRSMGGPLWRQVSTLRDIAKAVHHAHEQGILHRDLKPANILVDSDNVPHVADFGMAKNLQRKDPSLTETGYVVGTPCYMSPEQACGSREVDRRSDVYSLGVILYEMLAGEPPFHGKTPMETLLKAIQEPVRRPSTASRGGKPLRVDRGIERICLKALAKDPQHRHPTALAFAQDLDRWLAGEKVSPELPWRGRAGWAIVIAAAAALAVGYVFLRL